MYDTVRRPRSQRVIKTSREAGDTYAFRGPAGSDCGLLREELAHRFNWIWEHDVAQDSVRAIALLDAAATEGAEEAAWVDKGGYVKKVMNVGLLLSFLLMILF